jgi:hypothetical protein
LGVKLDAVKKIESGHATTNFAKLANLARAIESTPNVILDFPDLTPGKVTDRAVFKAVLEGAFLAFDLPDKEASALGEAALEALNSHVLHSNSTRRRDNARTVAQHEVSKALLSAKR